MTVRAALILAVVFAVLLTPIAASAEQSAKMPRIGYVAGGPLPFREGFRRGLRELGYVESQNVLVEYRWTGGRAERAQELLAELVGLNVDVIVAVGPPPAYAAKRATTTIPVVMVGVVEPAAAGLVASLARPGGNVTGLAFDVSPEIVRKLLELLKEAAPQASRAVVLWNPANPGDGPYLTELQAAAGARRVALAIVEVRAPDGLDRAFTAILEHRPDALVVLSDPMLNVHRKPIVAFAAKNRIPTAYRLRDAVDDGGLMSYAVNLTELNRRAASYVDRILKGAKPGDLPVEQPTKFELVINLKTAKALGLTIPQSLLLRADQVIE